MAEICDRLRRSEMGIKSCELSEIFVGPNEETNHYYMRTVRFVNLVGIMIDEGIVRYEGGRYLLNG